MTALPIPTKTAVAVLAFLSLGALLTGLDLLLRFLPPALPAIQHLHAASALGKTLWVGAGVLGGTSIVCLVRGWIKLGFIAVIAFAAAYTVGAKLVWLYFTWGCWLAILAVILTIFGARRHEG